MKGGYRVYMKQKLVRIVAFCLVVGMIFSVETNNLMLAATNADECVIVEDKIDFEGESAVEKTDFIENATSMKEHVSKICLNEKIGIPLTSYEVDMVAECTESAEGTESVVYYGTNSGYLSATNDYLLYPANLSAGDYLQVELDLPDVTGLDYDLLLFDASLTLIKSCDYVTYDNGDGTLEESIGYQATAEETVYVCVYSVGGGSTTKQYNLTYTITTNHNDATEPNENAKEADVLDLAGAGATVTQKLNSPIDNDWYMFTVVGGPAQEKIRLAVSSVTGTNGYEFELYRNLVTQDYYGMQFLGRGTGGEVELPAGTYYVRVVSTNTLNNFDATDIGSYSFSVKPVSRVDRIKITEIVSANGVKVEYDNGLLHRMDSANGNVVAVKGTAYYVVDGVEYPAVNACILGTVYDEQWDLINRPDMAYEYSSAIVDEGGSYRIKFYLNSPLGGLSYNALISTHYYDLMDVTVCPEGNENLTAEAQFYYLKNSVQ